MFKRSSRAATRSLCLFTLLTCALALLPFTAALAQPAPDPFGGTVPPDEATGYVPLPEGDVFLPLLADPKSGNSFISYVRGMSTSALGTDLLSVGIGDRFGISRWGGYQPGDGFQISLEGAVFAQFDLNAESYDLLNADYVLGLPFTYRRGIFSGRARLYHQSSHLGDEFLLRPGVQREDLSFESAEVLLSVNAGWVRGYGGGEIALHSNPEGSEKSIVHGGVEFRQPSSFRMGSVASARLVAAGDAKVIEKLDWDVAVSARAGFEVTRARPTEHVGRRWSLLGEFYDGPSPYGQFFTTNVRYYGVGLHFSL